MAKKNIFKAKKAEAAMEELPEDRGANGEDRSAGTPESDAQASKPPLPLFYKNPQPLHNVRHAHRRVKNNGQRPPHILVQNTAFAQSRTRLIRPPST